MTAIITSRPNVPEEVVIGTQIWMKRNYDFGGTYPDDVYDNINDYGKLYTWGEAMDINYPGWHLPTYSEYQTLCNYLGGLFVSGGKLKKDGFDYWLNPNTGADNSSGFDARGAGYYDNAGVGEYYSFKEEAWFWTSSSTGLDVETFVLKYNSNMAFFDFASIIFPIYPYTVKKCSIRLIKD